MIRTILIIVQYCFLYRLSHFPSMRPVVYFGYSLGIARTATLLATAIKGTGKTPINIITQTVTYFRASGAASTALDAVVAIPMSFLLYRQEFRAKRWMAAGLSQWLGTDTDPDGTLNALASLPLVRICFQCLKLATYKPRSESGMIAL
jgi:hypothetical protein